MLLSVVIAAALVICAAFFGKSLPGGELLGGSLYQIIAIILAIVVSIVINMPMFYLMMGNSAYKKKDYKKALVQYKKALKTKRLAPDMAIYCGYAALREGDIKEAEEAFDEVGKKKLNERQKASLDTNRALLEWKKGSLDKGIALLADAWERQPSAVSAGSLGALMLVKARETGDYSLAEEFCRSAWEEYKYDKTALCNLAEAVSASGKLEEAEELFEELMDMRPETPSPYYNYALTLKALGRDEDAADMARKALRCRFTALTPVKREDVQALLDEREL